MYTCNVINNKQKKHNKMQNQNSNIDDLLKTLNSYTRLVDQKIKNQNNNKKIELANKIAAGTKFTLTVLYNKKQYHGLYYDEIPLEGPENALMIFEEYRKIGFNLNLKNIQLDLDGEKVKKVNFKYRGYTPVK